MTSMRYLKQGEAHIKEERARHHDIIKRVPVKPQMIENYVENVVEKRNFYVFHELIQGRFQSPRHHLTQLMFSSAVIF